MQFLNILGKDSQKRSTYDDSTNKISRTKIFFKVITWAPGTDVVFLKIFSPKNLAIIIIIGVFVQNTVRFLPKTDHNIGL
jgi:hypothetical protein